MRLFSAVAFSLAFVATVQAAPTTSTGKVSINQVMEMIELSRIEPAARNAVIAYLAGVGETAGIMASEAVARGARPLACTQSFTLSEDAAVAALSAAGADRSGWAETAATPIILADLFARAGCK